MGREVKIFTERTGLGDLCGDYALPCRVLLANGRMRVNKGPITARHKHSRYESGHNHHGSCRSP